MHHTMQTQRQARRRRCRSPQVLCCPTAMRPLACSVNPTSMQVRTWPPGARAGPVGLTSSVVRPTILSSSRAVPRKRLLPPACEHAADACEAAHNAGAAAASVCCKPAGVHAASAARNSDRPPAMDVTRRLRRQHDRTAFWSAVLSARAPVESCRRWSTSIQAGWAGLMGCEGGVRCQIRAPCCSLPPL